MSVTPEHFLNFANASLNYQNANEFDYRNSASRAYYAAFHCCYAERTKCPDLNEEDIKGSHDKLYARFQALPLTDENSILKSMAYISKMMKAVRHSADYHLSSNFSKDDGEQQLKDAKKVMEKWNKIKQ